ncbi:MAG: S-layer homology domain-containing protein [Clostridiales bacterium]|nr:S-layer homology domain-containing protein [Clostridiales bacterium]
MKKYAARIIALLLSALYLSTLPPRTPLANFIESAYGATDDFLFTDPLSNVYSGRLEARKMIENLKFSDVPEGYWAKDAIIRAGALDIVKGSSKAFRPDAVLTNEEALAFILRLLGMEQEAHAAGAAMANQLPPEYPTDVIWSLGYLNQAMQMGLINQAQFSTALVYDQAILDPELDFVRSAPAPRERVADWLLRGIGAGQFPMPSTEQSIYQISDWKSISIELIETVEIFLANNIMPADGSGRFRPKGSMTRAEMMDAIKRLGAIYLNSRGIAKKTGTVGSFKDAQSRGADGVSLERDIYIRTPDGGIEVFRYFMNRGKSEEASEYDAVVLREGEPSGLGSLKEGDRIEYLVREAEKTVLYVSVQNSDLEIKKVYGKLKSIDAAGGTVSIVDANGKTFEYPMVKSLALTEDGIEYVRFKNEKIEASKLPLGSAIEISLKNNVADALELKGEQAVRNERMAIVLENDANVGFMTLLSGDGEEYSKIYNPLEIKVERQNYYDLSDEIGNIDSVFPSFKHDPRDAGPSSVMPGDVISYHPDPEDAERILSISASENFRMAYGRIKEFEVHENASHILIELEDGQTSSFTAPKSIFISKGGRPIKPEDVMSGDYGKFIVCQAVLAPGRFLESVREIEVESGGHEITNVVTGQLAGFDPIQREIIIQNSYELTKEGWTGYRQISRYSFEGDAGFFDEGVPVSLDYCEKRLKRAADVYLALENSYSGEKARKISFRKSRNEILNADTVLSSDLNGSFFVAGNSSGAINADAGTIVRRFGRLVDGGRIFPFDYAVVCLNGMNRAAVVDIKEMPGTSGVRIARGRVESIEEGKRFRVESMSILAGSSWVYTPVRRVFPIDGETLYINAGGVASNSSFIGYTEETALNKVFNIVIDGAKAARIIDAPHSRKAVKGAVYGKTESTLLLKDAACFDAGSGVWKRISLTNATAEAEAPQNGIIVKNSRIVGFEELEIGDQVRVFTDKLPDAPASGMRVAGYIILVEK